MQQRGMDNDDLRLAEVIAALSLATDLAMGQPMGYSLRSCLLAMRLGDTLSLDDRALSRPTIWGYCA